MSLDQFDVGLDAADPVPLRTRWDESEAERWSLRPLDIGADYVAALAVEGNGWQLRCRQVDEKMINELYCAEYGER